nr:MAG TPA: hypothetical protein [Caudoviricetes sp.]
MFFSLSLAFSIISSLSQQKRRSFFVHISGLHHP